MRQIATDYIQCKSVKSASETVMIFGTRITRMTQITISVNPQNPRNLRALFQKLFHAICQLCFSNHKACSHFIIFVIPSAVEGLEISQKKIFSKKKQSLRITISVNSQNQRNPRALFQKLFPAVHFIFYGEHRHKRMLVSIWAKALVHPHAF